MKPLRTYEVTMTPKFPCWHDRPETAQITARTREEAIAQARRDVRNAGRDRHDGPLIYRAKLAAPSSAASFD